MQAPMARGSSRWLSPWDAAVAETVAKGTRYRLRKVGRSPFIYVRDLKAPPGAPSEWSLAPLCRDEPDHVRQAHQRILAAGDGPWLEPTRSRVATNWCEVVERCEQDWPLRLKASSLIGPRTLLRRMARERVPLSREGIERWAMEVRPGSSAFLHRLDTLTQIRRSLRPEWLPLELMAELRERHRHGRSPGVTPMSRIRGIPTRQEAEAYLDALPPKWWLERWFLAMMLCYGLRNHEPWWIEPITTEAPGVVPGWVLVPGWWRTKSRQEHWTWPLWPEWIERFQLRELQERAQAELHRRLTAKVVSVRDRSKPWVPGMPDDPGVAINNHHLGDWITKRMRRLPPWMARVPGVDGSYSRRQEPQRIRPYDLRHTWAVTVAIDPRWRHVSDEEAARAMGHTLAVHRNRYQRWIDAVERRNRAMAAVRLPGM